MVFPRGLFAWSFLERCVVVDVCVESSMSRLRVCARACVEKEREFMTE